MTEYPNVCYDRGRAARRRIDAVAIEHAGARRMTILFAGVALALLVSGAAHAQTASTACCPAGAKMAESEGAGRGPTLAASEGYSPRPKQAESEGAGRGPTLADSEGYSPRPKQAESEGAGRGPTLAESDGTGAAAPCRACP